jgi:hypothetical protein
LKKGYAMAKKKWLGIAAMSAAIGGAVAVWVTKFRGKGNDEEVVVEVEAVIEEVVVDDAPEVEDEASDES